MSKLDQKHFEYRRNKLFKNMEDNSVLILGGEVEKARNNDVNFEFRQDSVFWYLSGLEEPDALMVMLKKDSEQYILFLQEKKIEEERQVFKRTKPLKTRLTGKDEEAHKSFLQKLGPGAMWNKLIIKS